jgi:ssDNA-binding Zn-finger/Zn-ribbon topoisomerase 1
MSQCPDCGIEFKCGVVEPGDDAPCWCMQLPPSPIASEAKANGEIETAGCVCPTCLRRRIDETEEAKEARKTEAVKNPH